MATTLNLLKYRTLGNEFIIVDNRDGSFDGLVNDTTFKHHLNHRTFGVGATGIVEVLPATCNEHVFAMRYHIGSGELGLACGTGSRCLTAFARDAGMVKDGEEFRFHSHEGERRARIVDKLANVTFGSDLRILNIIDRDNYFIYSGVYVHVRFTESGLASNKIVKEGTDVVLADHYKQYFPTPTYMLVQPSERGGISVRCYDHTTTQEAEVKACGTGEVAAAMAYLKKMGLVGEHSVPIRWQMGTVTVTLTRDKQDKFSNISVEGEAMFLFSASLDVEKFKQTYKDHERAP